MNLQMGKDLKQKASYDYWKPYLIEKLENMKRFSSLLSSEADTTARVSVVETAPVPEASHKCSICGKCFSSGKALGGHSRSHSQASKKMFSSNSKEGTTTTTTTTTSVNFNYGDDDIRYNDEKKDHVCYVCKKIFSTDKALYGHMRSHPDRVCKGISPPTKNHQHVSHDQKIQNKNCSSNSQSSISSMEQKKEDKENGFVDLKGCSDIDVSKSPLPKWKKRDKRGRKCSEIYEAAMNLVHLSANIKHLSSSESIKEFVPKSFVESTMKKRELGESSSSVKEVHAIKRIKFVVGGSLKLGNKSKTVFCDSHVLNKGKGCLSEYDYNLEPSESPGPQRLDIDLNEPYIMED